MTKKLSDYYEGEYVAASMIDLPLFSAVADGVQELEVTKEEFISVIQYAIYNKIYTEIMTDNKFYRCVLGMRLKILN